MKITLAQIPGFLVLTGTCLLAGCSESTPPEDGGGVTPNPRAEGTLERATEASLSAYFRAASSANLNRVSAPTDGVQLESVANDAGSTADSTTGFSTTTLQETGVDEADLIKTDGQYIYSIDRNDNAIFPLAEDGLAKPADGSRTHFEQSIRIMQTTASSAELQEVKRVSLTSEAGRLSGIYLANQNQRLVTLGSGADQSAYDWFYSPYFQNQTTDVHWIDVTDPAQAEIEHKLSFDGVLVSSRRVDDTLYLVLRHYPDQFAFPLDGREPADLSTKTAQDFLPESKIDNQAKQAAVDVQNCYVNTGVADQRADVITLAAVDLNKASPEFKSVCYVGSSEAIYASTNALYLASTRWDYNTSGNTASYDPAVTTDIHKFDFNQLDFDYRGSAEVGGHLGWNQDRKSFRMSESSDGKNLRVITYNEQRPWIALGIDSVALEDTSTTTNEDAAPPPNERPVAESSPVMLTILEENTQKAALDIVSQLPNRDRPDSIGKPGEQLYASRFIGDRAYIVTFRITDPLYILDLSNPHDPLIAGELEIDGYSDFLYVVGENLLLGVGKDAIADSNNVSDFRGGAWYQGVKLSLIDVTIPANPSETDKVIIGKRGTESPALHDHHAITRLQTNGTTRIALPITLHDTEPGFSQASDPSRWYDYTQSGLYRYEIDIASKSIIKLPALITHDKSTPRLSDNSFETRSVIIGDNVHFLQDGEYWSQDWAGTLPATGPK